MDLSKKLEKALRTKIICLENKYSKRNNVYLMEAITGENLRGKFIVKEYKISLSAGNEVFILHMLKKHGLRVPQIIWYDDQILVMEYIHGLLLAELLEKQGIAYDLWVNALVKWLYELHSLMSIDNNVLSNNTGLCMADLNLRNFIFDGRVFYGIDFENMCFHPPERDIGVICAFILNNDPMFTNWKFQICNSMIRSYNVMLNKDCSLSLNPGMIWDYLIEELQAAAERRKPQRELINAYIKGLNFHDIFGW